MQIKEAIILAGGLGTRLRSVLPDLPKCMAPVNGRPFLAYIIEYFQKQGIERFIFSLGYKHEAITAWLKETYPLLSYAAVIEEEPLGTGGAIKLAISKTETTDVLILNGDTFFEVNLQAMASFHSQKKAACTLALKPMTDFNRYGVVETDKEDRIKSFKEKKYYAEGLINGGIYLLNTALFQFLPMPEKFSFEKDYFEQYFSSVPMYGFVQKGFFIDIGIPEDFEKAQTAFPLKK
ncbi:MAG: nucleotidyltransferase family protein [Chitinophagaceae bacterium]